MDIETLMLRMKACNRNSEYGATFKSDGKVILWWQISLFEQYTIELMHHETSAKCQKFQRAMFKARKDMEVLQNVK